MKKRSLFFALILAILCTSANAQRRDYLTDSEIDLVRDSQQIDLRVSVLTRAADRRLIALGLITPQAPSKKEKDADKWGSAPTGSRLDLLDDFRRIMQKAVDDIDNLAERPDSIVLEEPDKNQKPKKYEDVFPKAVHELADAAKRYQPLLKREMDNAKDEKEKGVILQSLDLCSEIIDAESRLPATVQAKKTGN